jgi:hypothetical protein
MHSRISDCSVSVNNADSDAVNARGSPVWWPQATNSAPASTDNVTGTRHRANRLISAHPFLEAGAKTYRDRVVRGRSPQVAQHGAHNVPDREAL